MRDPNLINEATIEGIGIPYEYTNYSVLIF